MTRAAARRRAPNPSRRPTRDPYGLLPKGVPIAAVLSIVGPAASSASSRSASSDGQPPVHAGARQRRRRAAGERRDPGADADAVERRHRPDPGARASRSRARWSTRRTATSGSRPTTQATQLTNVGQRLDAVVLAGRQGRLLRPHAPGRRQVEHRRRDQGLPARRPDADARRGRRQRQHGAPARRPHQPGRRFKWNGFIREPVVSPDGRYVAMATDLPDPTNSDVTLKLFDLQEQQDHATSSSTRSRRSGHQDPAWKPDGSRAALRPQRPRRGQGHAAHLLLEPGHRQDAGRDRARLPPPVVVAGRQVHRGDPDVGVRHRRRDPQRRRPAPSSCASRTTATAGRPSWSPRGDQIAYLHVAGQVIDLRMAQLEGSGPTWTMKDADRPHDSGRARRRLAAGLVRPGRPTSRRPTPLHGAPAESPVAVVTSYLDRLGARTAATGTVLCVGHRPGPGRAARRASRRRSRASSGSRGSSSRRRSRTPPRSSPTSRSSRRTGRAGIAALERLRALVPADVPFVADAKRGDIGSTAARQAVGAVRRAGRGRRHRQPVPGRGGDRAAARARRTGSRTCCAGRPTRARASSRASRSPRTRPPARPAEPLWARVARRVDGAGARRRRSGSSSAPRRPRSWPRSARIAPGLAFLVPGVGAQGGEVEPVLADGPATAAPAGGRPGGGLLVNVSRGIARAAARRARDAGPASGRPRRAPRGGRRGVGRNASLCYPDALPRRLRSRPGPTRGRSTTMPFNIGPGELIIVLVIALIVVGPGKLPDVGAALGKSIREFRKAATDVKDATSLEDPAPAPAVAAAPRPGRDARPPRRSPPRRPDGPARAQRDRRRGRAEHDRDRRADRSWPHPSPRSPPRAGAGAGRVAGRAARADGLGRTLAGSQHGRRRRRPGRRHPGPPDPDRPSRTPRRRRPRAAPAARRDVARRPPHGAAQPASSRSLIAVALMSARRVLLQRPDHRHPQGAAARPAAAVLPGLGRRVLDQAQDRRSSSGSSSRCP